MGNAVSDQLAALWFRHHCTLISGAGDSPYGPSIGVRIPVKGFIRQSTRRVLGVSGDELVTDTTLRLPIVIVHEGEPVAVQVGDRVELPEPFAGTWGVVEVAVNHGAGQSTPDHQKLTLKEVP